MIVYWVLFLVIIILTLALTAAGIIYISFQFLTLYKEDLLIQNVCIQLELILMDL